eukprot:EG_transcript_7090
MDVYVGVDVGTGSVRAGVFSADGRMLAKSEQAIRILRPLPDYVEQSSEDIWAACIQCVRAAVTSAEVAPAQVKGLGFDATCSLVVVDGGGRPVTVSPTGLDEQNVIVWMDHRATAQTNTINQLGHDVLRYIGGVMSPEMETPKLLWLKQQLPETWRRAGHYFDLPDYLTWRATGSPTRSLCSSVCKWTYLGHEEGGVYGSVGRWEESYFRQLGLEDLLLDSAAKIGGTMRPLGEPVGQGLTAEAADQLGLVPGTVVSTSIIDAHAGGLGVLGADADTDAADDLFERRIALIGGTSSCHMAVSRAPRFIPGVWGPYFSAMVPAFWLNEGGQSATGALLDHVIFSHTASEQLAQRAAAEATTVYRLLNDELQAMAQAAEVPHPALLTRELHVLPYFHGNRSPRADPLLTGAVVGLHLRSSVQELALLYLATIQAIAMGTRHIIDTMNEAGYRIDTVMACGGGTKNPVWLQEHANATRCTLVLPREPEAVLLGGALLGAVASGRHPTIPTAMRAMGGAGDRISPQAETETFYARKYRVFLELYEDHQKYKRLMAE